MAKVTEFTVANFRGISEVVTVNLTARNKRAISVILYGDNGSGKSSLVDALEFALRGRLSRRNPEGQKIRREVRNLAIGGAPGVVVKLDDNVVIRRGGGLAKLGITEYPPGEMVEGFQYSPLIVRRQDIEFFWRVPEDERQAFFFDYLKIYQSFSVRRTRDRLEAKLRDASAEHAKVASRLARLTGIPEHVLPTTFAKTDSFLRRKLLPEFGKWNQLNQRKQLPRPQWVAFLALQGALKRKEDLTGQLRQLPEPGPVIDRELTRILQSLTIKVTADFATISKLAWIDKVEIVVGTESQLSITLILSNGKRVDPTQILSEAYLDLLALLILVEVHVECATLGQNPVIVLDDVFQSVDAVNRIRALNHILARLEHWQVIITLHDRLWLELARRAMQRANHQHVIREVLPGGFGVTPQLRRAPGRSAEELQTYIEQRESSEAIAGCAGRVLEELCGGLSISLAARISRRPDDRYTLGDLWPGVASSLKKHGPENIREAADDVSRFIDLRNIVGAHYNEFAATLASQEAIEFGEVTLRLWEACKCPKCGSLFGKYVSTDGRSDLYTWSCDHVRGSEGTQRSSRSSLDGLRTDLNGRNLDTD